MSTMNICDKRGHYFLPIEVPASDGFFWSVVPPHPETRLYCRRCGEQRPLSRYTSTSTGTVSFKNISATFYLGTMDPTTYKPKGSI